MGEIVSIRGINEELFRLAKIEAAKDKKKIGDWLNTAIREKLEGKLITDEDPPELEEWEEYWEENAKLDKNKKECLPVPNDEIPDCILEAQRAGLLKRRPNFEYDKEKTCYTVYEKA